jgi:signal transduction histidine kinase
MTMTERRVRLGFRARVLGSIFALLLGATAVGVLAQRAVLLARFDREVDAALEQERAEVERLASGVDPATGQPFAGDVAAIFTTFLQRNLPDDGEVFIAIVDGAPFLSTPAPVRLDEDPALVADWGALTEGEWGTATTTAGPARYLAVPLRFEGQTRGTFVIANFVAEGRSEIDAIVRTEAVVTLVVVLVATAVAWWIAGRLLRPVRELTEAAEGITDADLGRRIQVEGDDEIARLGARFNDMLDRLESSFAVQRAFVDDAGHELRTPITVIKGHLAVMGDDPEDRERTMGIVRGELDRMARIVEDLLVLAKAEQPDFVRPEPTEVADFTTALMVKSQALGDRRWRLDACATGVVPADEQRLTQAVLNLVRNAVEHTTDGAEIGLGSRWTTEGLHLWVRDTGPGIPPEEQQRIFERFARGPLDARRGDGAGLGLSIVRSVVEAHGGRVELESRPGDGARFTLVLPGLPPPPDDRDGLDLDDLDDDLDDGGAAGDDVTVSDLPLDPDPTDPDATDPDITAPIPRLGRPPADEEPPTTRESR